MAVVFGLVVLAVCVGLGLRAKWRGDESARQKVAEDIAQIAQAFPDAVQAWGGAALLQDTNAVKKILEILQETPKERDQGDGPVTRGRSGRR